jgi:3-phenylpropionate/trans-cinnamate dioxygenase ferredoxin subunit
VVVFNVQGEIHAIENSSPHNGASLASGQSDRHILRCPAHGLRFDLRTGCMPRASGLCIKTYAVQTQDDGTLVLEEEQLR